MEMPALDGMEEMLAHLDRTLMGNGLLAAGDAVVVVAGLSAGRPGKMNLMTVRRIGEPR
jgi:pyruvate kinase